MSILGVDICGVTRHRKSFRVAKSFDSSPRSLGRKILKKVVTFFNLSRRCCKESEHPRVVSRHLPYRHTQPDWTIVASNATDSQGRCHNKYLIEISSYLNASYPCFEPAHV